jgi:hypothetical protein
VCVEIIVTLQCFFFILLARINNNIPNQGKKVPYFKFIKVRLTSNRTLNSAVDNIRSFCLKILLKFR